MSSSVVVASWGLGDISQRSSYVSQARRVVSPERVVHSLVNLNCGANAHALLFLASHS